MPGGGRATLCALVATAVALLAAAPAHALDGWSYGGTTSQRSEGSMPYPFAYDELLGTARFAVSLTCDDGGAREDVYSVDVPELPANGPGELVFPGADGQRVVLEFWLTRTVRRGTMRGRLRVRRRVEQNEAPVETCDSGFVRFSARDDVFAGDLAPDPGSRGAVVSAGLSRDGRRLSSFVFDWATRDCPRAGGGNGFLAATTRVPSIGVRRNGSFSARGSYRGRTPSGNELLVRYTVAGSMDEVRSGGRRRTVMFGYYRVAADLREARGGFRIRNCPTGLVFFGAER